jgi:tetratricopeptide (TPR) repeat protein
MAIWIGVGLFQVFEWIPRLVDRMRLTSAAKAATGAMCGILTAGFILPLGIHYSEMDRSEHEYALRYGERLLDTLPENAALFTSDGHALFILWYLIYCEDMRPDVMVMDPTWLAGGVALRSQALEQYPDLKFPERETLSQYVGDETDPEASRLLIIQAALDANSSERPVYWGLIQRNIPFARRLVPEGLAMRYSPRPVELDDSSLVKDSTFWELQIAELRADPKMQKDTIAREVYPVELNNQGMMFEQMGRDDLARRATELALEFNPEYPTGRYNLGRLEARAGNHEAALREHGLAIEADPKMVSARFGRGNALRSLGRFDEALLAYREATRLEPGYHEAITAMGRLYVLAGQNEDAVESFERAIEIEPSYAFAHRGLAGAYLEANRLNDAKKALDKALELEPRSAPGLFMLSKYYTRIAADEEAADTLAQSIACGGKDFLNQALDDEDLREVAENFGKGEADT